MKKGLLRFARRFLLTDGRQKKLTINRFLNRHLGTDALSTFDEAFYRAQLPPGESAPDNLLDHYLHIGAWNGLDPCVHFSSADYLEMNPDVAADGINPWVHYVLFGITDQRVIRPSALSGFYHVATFDEELFLDYVDPEFYLEQTPTLAQSEIDPWRHYLSVGWRQGLDPRSDFSTDEYLAKNADVMETGVNPLIHYLEFGWREGRETFISSFVEKSKKFAKFKEDHHRELAAHLSPYFDADFYLKYNTDVRNADVDPFWHYVMTGWQELRDPNPSFSVAKFLKHVPEARFAIEQGVVPILYAVDHDLLFEDQRRKPKDIWRAGNDAEIAENLSKHSGTPLDSEDVADSDVYAAAHVLKTLQPLDERAKDWPDPDLTDVLNSTALSEILNEKLSDHTKIIISVSHDLYTKNVGGVQLCVSREAEISQKQGIPYLHIYPAKPLPKIAEDDLQSLHLTISFDGDLIGSCASKTFLETLTNISQKIEINLVVHQMLGSSFELISALSELSQSAKRYFWIHDYLSICPGLNLLRNDLTYCHGPESSSQSCRVCIYRALRLKTEDKFSALFEKYDYQFVAPSMVALNIWKDHFPQFSDKIQMVRHCELSPRAPKAVPEQMKREEPIRIAFIGHPVLAKGWQSFARTVNTFRDDPDCKFFHFSTERVNGLDLTWVPTSVTQDNRKAMIDALVEHKIDIVLQLSLWPETFCLAAYEAIAAGAFLLACKDSGNAARLAEEKFGRLVGSSPELIALLESDDFKSEIRKRRKKSRKYFDLKLSSMIFELSGDEGLLVTDSK